MILRNVFYIGGIGYPHTAKHIYQIGYANIYAAVFSEVLSL
jgi:hypothetical protein